jgi:nucleotide-binding universal stress UspA family protein
MMRTFLVPLAPALASEPALDAALALARRLNSHIQAVFVRPDPALALSYFPADMATPATSQTIETESLQAQKRERARFEAWRSRHGIAAEPADNRLDTPFASWSEETGEIEPVVTRRSRVSDLIVLKRFMPNEITAQRCFDAALFGSGRPTLLVPEQSPWDLIDHVLIAWNGSLEASHAVFGVLPLLRAAGRVSLFSVPGPENDGASGADLAAALSWQGIPVHQAIVRPGTNAGTNSVGAALLATAADNGVTLIVMGAYTHSRLRQSFLGGVTMHVLSHAAIPVVMSH